MENQNEVTLSLGTSVHSSLAHEQLARDEQFVGAFLATMLINVNKEKYNINTEKNSFIDYYKDTELYVSQHIFAKKIIDTPSFREFMEYLSLLLMKAQANNKSPLEVLLSSFKRGDKAFLIRQIFRHTDQVLEKYRFLSEFTNITAQDIDLDKLNKGLWHLPIEQRFLCASYIFSKLKDDYLEEKESIKSTIKKQENAQGDFEINSPEEMAVNSFFNAFYIQYLLHKDLSNVNIFRLNFLEPHINDTIYASQRVFIKNLISNPNYRILCEEMKSLFLEYNESKALSPCTIFLGKLNKDSLLKEIFVSHSFNAKYKFLPMFVSNLENGVNFDDLYNKTWHLSQEQQITIFAYLFSKIKDNKLNKKKMLKDSFLENCKKVKEFNEMSGRSTQIEADNLISVISMLNAMVNYK